jgi:hypothetical protein
VARKKDDLKRSNPGDDKVQDKGDKHSQTHIAAVKLGKSYVVKTFGGGGARGQGLKSPVYRSDGSHQYTHAGIKDDHAKGGKQHPLYYVGKTFTLQDKPQAGDQSQKNRGIAQNIGGNVIQYKHTFPPKKK